LFFKGKQNATFYFINIKELIQANHLQTVRINSLAPVVVSEHSCSRRFFLKCPVY